MSNIVEIAVTSDNNGSQWTCSAWNPRTETNYMVYKGGGPASSNSLAFIGDEYLITSNNSKPIINIWPLNSQDQVSGARFIAPGKISALAVSPDGVYLIAGIQESIYIWNLASGKMLAAISKHYQSVIVIKFIDDGTHFISAGQDGNILVWNLTAIVCPQLNKSQPVYAFKDHGLSVSDLHLGTGGIQAMLYSVSIDRTCRIYDLSDGTQLLNLVFPEALQCVVVNRPETIVYVGTANGAIYDFSIVAPHKKKEYHLTDEDVTRKLSGHVGGVTCLALSIDDVTLLSGGTDANVCIWNVSSRQLLRTIPHKGAITNVVIRIFPIHVVSQTTDKRSARLMVASNLKRMMGNADDENDVIEVMVNERIEMRQPIPERTNGHGGQVAAAGDPSSKLSAVVASDDVTQLRAKIQQLEAANKQLYEFCLQKIILPDRKAS